MCRNTQFTFWSLSELFTVWCWCTFFLPFWVYFQSWAVLVLNLFNFRQCMNLPEDKLQAQRLQWMINWFSRLRYITLPTYKPSLSILQFYLHLLLASLHYYFLFNPPFVLFLFFFLVIISSNKDRFLSEVTKKTVFIAFYGQL